MNIRINNGREMKLTEESGALMVEIIDCDGYMEDVNFIHEGDIVMLYNYWRNCKSGREISDYITPDIA